MTRSTCTDEMTSGGREEALMHGFYEFEAGDVVDACEMVLADKEWIDVSENLKSLPENI